MTSEGQHAGQQPADATSGAGGATAADATSAYGTPRTPDGFPPDSDHPGAPAAPPQAWGPSAYPNSYGPPPYPPASTGSPFVVPAVPVRPPGADTSGPGGPLHAGERPQPGDAGRAGPQPSSLQAGGPQPSSGFSPPARTDVPPEAWAPPPVAPPPADADASTEPHPYRSSTPAGPPLTPPMRPTFPPAGVSQRGAAGEPLPTRTPFGTPGGPPAPSTPTGFNGFAAASTPAGPGSRAAAGPAAPQAAGADDAPGARAPGVSAFGDQRIRVPGATLTGLPDAREPGGPAGPAAFPMTGPDRVHTPAGAPAAQPGGDGYPTRTGPDRSQDLGDDPRVGRQTSNGLPVRGGGHPAQPAQAAFPVQGGTGFAPRTFDGPDQRRSPDAPRTDPPFGAAAPMSHDAGGSAERPVPQPRTPTESSFPVSTPAVGTARPVSASASVPVASRVAPPSDIDELPPVAAPPQPRVYGRPPQSEPTDLAAPPGATPSVAAPPVAAPPVAAPPVAAPPVAAPPVAAPPVAAPPVAPVSRQSRRGEIEDRTAFGSRPVPDGGAATDSDRMPDRRSGADAWTGPDGRARAFELLPDRPVSPTAGQPVPGQPTSGQPVPGQPTSRQPVPGQPTSGQPVSGQPTSGQSRPGQSASGQHPSDLPSGPPSSGQPAPDRYGPSGRPPTGRATASARVTPPPSSAVPFGAEQPFRPGQPPAPGSLFGSAAPTAGTPGPHAPSQGAGSFGPPPAAQENGPFGPPPPNGPFGPPPPAQGTGGGWQGNPYSEHTTDVAGRGRNLVPPGPANGREPSPADQYSEHTSDVAGRGRATDRPYVPEPALPSMHASTPLVDGFPAARTPSDPPQQSGRPQLDGAFPGRTSRATVTPPGATVTPPGATETASWPAPAEHTEQGRFEAFKPEPSAATPEKTEMPSVRMVPVLLAVVLAAVLVVGIAMGLVWLIAPSESGFDVSAGDCVKRDGDRAVTATCGQAGTFEVVSKVDTKEQCPDPGQPYVLNPSNDGRTQVLCLKPSS